MMVSLAMRYLKHKFQAGVLANMHQGHFKIINLALNLSPQVTHESLRLLDLNCDDILQLRIPHWADHSDQLCTELSAWARIQALTHQNRRGGRRILHPVH